MFLVEHFLHQVSVKCCDVDCWSNLYFSVGLRDCRTSKQEHRRVSFSRSIDTDATDTSVYLPTIVDELRSEDYDIETLPYFQRIAVSGEEMSGVSSVTFWALCASRDLICKKPKKTRRKWINKSHKILYFKLLCRSLYEHIFTRYGIVLYYWHTT